MLAIERRNQILAQLQQEKKVIVSDLSQQYNVTEETIRRDLDKLEQQGFATKTYGGAILYENATIEVPYGVRRLTHVEGKKKIAECAQDLVEDGDRIMLDASSTALFITKKIKNKKNLTIITNSIQIMMELADHKGFNVLCTGGNLKEGAFALTGYQAERMLSSFNVDKAFISCKGIDLIQGLTDASESDAEIKKCILKAAKQRILLVDESKFDKISFVKFAELEQIDCIITEKEPKEQWKNFFYNKKIDVKWLS